MLSVIFGLVGVVVGVLWLASWGGWAYFLIVLQGSVPPFLILVGAVAVAAGISSIKDNMQAKKEQEKIDQPPEETESAGEGQDKEESSFSEEGEKEI